MDDLIANLAPKSVPFRALGDVIKLKFGTRITKRDDAGNLYPVYGGGGESFRTDDFNREDECVVSRFAMSETCVRRVKGRFWMLDSGFTFEVVMPSVIKEYVAYWLLSHQHEIYACSSQGAQKNLKTVEFKNFDFPVPPLKVQREIVRILDQFTQLEAELEAELEARRRQYQHYRDRALAPSNEVLWSTLGEVSKAVSSGGTPLARSAEYYEGGHIPWLRTNEVKFCDIWETDVRITEAAVDQTSAKWIPKNCVILAISGATAGRSAINKIPLTTNQHCCNLEIDPSQAEYRYVFYWVCARYAELKSLGRGARSDLNAALIKGFRIPIPSLEKQREIVAFLDRFDLLVNDLSGGLPAELVARRKQYEYYRNKLLTFETVAA